MKKTKKIDWVGMALVFVLFVSLLMSGWAGFNLMVMVFMLMWVLMT